MGKEEESIYFGFLGNKTKSCFFEKINKINKHLATLIREGNGTPLRYSCLENPMDGGAWWAAVHGVTR